MCRELLDRLWRKLGQEMDAAHELQLALPDRCLRIERVQSPPGEHGRHRQDGAAGDQRPACAQAGDEDCRERADEEELVPKEES